MYQDTGTKTVSGIGILPTWNHTVVCAISVMASYFPSGSVVSNIWFPLQPLSNPSTPPMDIKSSTFSLNKNVNNSDRSKSALTGLQNGGDNWSVNGPLRIEDAGRMNGPQHSTLTTEVSGHVVCMWYTQVVCMWCPSGVHVMWYPYGPPSVEDVGRMNGPKHMTLNTEVQCKAMGKLVCTASWPTVPCKLARLAFEWQ